MIAKATWTGDSTWCLRDMLVGLLQYMDGVTWKLQYENSME